SYIERYFQQNNTYYDGLRSALLDWFDTNPVQLPQADNADVVQIGFVTDRHCNIGMDRVTVALLKRLGVSTLVSGGDDAFSGTFTFESACTRNLADKSAQAGITDVFAAGNHDSPYTIAQEVKQGIKTLAGDPVTVGGLTFLGSPDPRSSRYGQGMRPAQSSVQHALLEAQATAIGSRACKAGAPIIVVLHDPAAGKEAMQRGCGNVTIDLGGHTHIQNGPNPVPLPNGGTGYQFIGASAGGAPSGSTTDRSLASQVTVGPLRNTATVNIVSIDKRTAALVGVTEFSFTPAMGITVSQQTLP
ncbi:MAG: metallophosphoesterase family protein, partial [Jatrophihabitantaceae bacterium]